MENETNNNEVVADVTESVVETTSESQTEGSTESTSYQSNNYQSTYNYGQNNYTGNNYGGTTTAQQPKKKKKKGSGKGIKVLAFVGKAAAFGIIAGGIMVGVNAVGNKTVNKHTKTAEVKTVTTADAGMKSSKTESDVADVAEEVMPSIVSITNTSVQVVRSWFQSYEQEVQGAGSGIIIGKTEFNRYVPKNSLKVQS